VVVRRADRPALVLGSTQDLDDVDRNRAARAGVAVVRRRSGGGAVLIGPADPLWLDLWVPRGDPLWSDDVVVAAWWVGEWWAAALRHAGGAGVAVHRGGGTGGPLARRICFAGVGPGEVTVEGRKVVGIAQWRCREGALFHTCAYRRFDPRAVTGLLAKGPEERRSAARDLGRAAAGLSELGMRAPSAAELVASLPPAPPWRST
jgi:lipoate-protein ligase A